MCATDHVRAVPAATPVGDHPHRDDGCVNALDLLLLVLVALSGTPLPARLHAAGLVGGLLVGLVAGALLRR